MLMYTCSKLAVYALFLGSVTVAIAVQNVPQRGSDVKLASQLRTVDERLLTAVHRGTRATWAAVITPDFIYVEEGSVVPRDEFLKELTEDGSEPLVISEFELHRIGDTAVVTHLDTVPETQQASRPGGKYLMTETWQRLKGEWKLRIVHIDAVHTDPPAITLNPAQLDELVGCYRSGTRSMTIRRDGSHLFRDLRDRAGAPEQELKAETRDVFYVPGDLRMRSIFQRGTDGKVTAVVRRDENSDRVFARAESSKAAQSSCGEQDGGPPAK